MALLVQAIAVDQNNARYHLGAACIGGGRTSHCGVVGTGVNTNTYTRFIQERGETLCYIDKIKIIKTFTYYIISDVECNGGTVITITWPFVFSVKHPWA